MVLVIDRDGSKKIGAKLSLREEMRCLLCLDIKEETERLFKTISSLCGKWNTAALGNKCAK